MNRYNLVQLSRKKKIGVDVENKAYKITRKGDFVK